MPFTFTNRIGGVSEAPFDTFNLALHVGDFESFVHENRAKLGDEIAIPVCYMDQFHSNEVAIVKTNDFAPKCDALITTENKLALAVMVSVFLGDPFQGPRDPLMFMSVFTLSSGNSIRMPP